MNNIKRWYHIQTKITVSDNTFTDFYRLVATSLDNGKVSVHGFFKSSFVTTWRYHCRSLSLASKTPLDLISLTILSLRFKKIKSLHSVCEAIKPWVPIPMREAELS